MTTSILFLRQDYTKSVRILVALSVKYIIINQQFYLSNNRLHIWKAKSSKNKIGQTYARLVDRMFTILNKDHIDVQAISPFTIKTICCTLQIFKHQYQKIDIWSSPYKSFIRSCVISVLYKSHDERKSFYFLLIRL